MNTITIEDDDGKKCEVEYEENAEKGTVAIHTTSADMASVVMEELESATALEHYYDHVSGSSGEDSQGLAWYSFAHSSECNSGSCPLWALRDEVYDPDYAPAVPIFLVDGERKLEGTPEQIEGHLHLQEDDKQPAIDALNSQDWEAEAPLFCDSKCLEKVEAPASSTTPSFEQAREKFAWAVHRGEKHPKLYLANAFSLSMLPQLQHFSSGIPGECIVSVAQLSEMQAEIYLQNNAFESIVGHEGTAAVMASRTGENVTVNREAVTLAEGDELLVFQLEGRLPEGKVLTAEEMADLPARWLLVTLEPYTHEGGRPETGDAVPPVKLRPMRLG